jgi:uncharacterized Zn-binding protein involved in type VI secretion
MPGWVRKGDVNEVGAPVIADVADTVLVNGKPAALKGSLIQGHAPGGIHAGGPIIVEGAGTVIVEGRLAAFKGASENCGHTQVEASDDVMIPGG